MGLILLLKRRDILFYWVVYQNAVYDINNVPGHFNRFVAKAGIVILGNIFDQNSESILLIGVYILHEQYADTLPFSISRLFLLLDQYLPCYSNSLEI